MKRILFSAAIIAASAITATAQEVARVSDISVVPSVLTSTGKPAPVGIDTQKQEVTIFDTEFNVVKKINYTAGTLTSRSYSEIATVKPTGAKVAWENAYDINSQPEYTEATTLNEMKNLLAEKYGINNCIGFIDYKGRTSCWSPDNTSCFASEWLGDKYPFEYYCIVDGHVKRVNVNYEPEFDQASIDNAQWTVEGDVTNNDYSIDLMYYDYLDYDANIAFDNGIRCSQTLFNDDDKWEYVICKYGAVEKHAGEYWKWSQNENGYVLRRNVSESQPAVGIDIKNEDGEIVASIETGGLIYDVYKLGGNIYFQLYEGGYDVLYKYDPKSTGVKEVSRSEAKCATVRVDGRSILVEANANDVNVAEIFDMGGRMIASSVRKGVSSLTINAAGAAEGVYSVALKNRGRIVGAQKILLK